MNIAIYRERETNKIKCVHEVKDEIMKDVTERLKTHNDNPKNDIAEVMTFADDSLEAFLFRERQMELKEQADSFECVQDDLNHIANVIDSLVYDFKRKCREKGIEIK